MVRSPVQRGLPYAVTDNTLLSRLVDLQIAQFLPLLFKQILIPPEVKREAYKAPHKGKRRLMKLFGEMTGFFTECNEADDLVKEYLKADLHDGEAAAIAQADITQSVLLIDEKKGYDRARTMQLTIVRTGRLLVMLKEVTAISEVRPYLERLKVLDFRLTTELFNQLLAEAGEE